MLLIQLTRRFQRLHSIAVFTLYSLLGFWVFIYLTYIFACWPVQRRWSLVQNQQCGPITRAWDFVCVSFKLENEINIVQWTHFSIHLTSDIIRKLISYSTADSSDYRVFLWPGSVNLPP